MSRSRVGSIRVGPDQRYWRRRANRRVRKARRVVSLLRWSLTVGVNGIVLAALLVAADRAYDYLTTIDEFAVRRIELSGLRHASPELIRARLSEQIDGNMLDLDLARIEQTVQADPWVRRAAVRRVLPDTLYVHVEERIPVAIAIVHDREWLVDSTGYVIGPLDAGVDGRFPVLDGLDAGDERALERDLRRGVTVLERLRATSEVFARGVARVDLAHPDRVEVTQDAAGPKILLDPDRIEQNLIYFMALRATIERRVGAADYIDLRWRDRISVMPAKHSARRSG
ncbi:MAG TPA: FtsQ-type POTRA domain-containing protein [Candidatus Polarisedimenticolaceae bacterium]|nr:FtsQ-type POTRA domain-containing protein [Candidatus Polarisedimenticolaceae bacterium]